MAFTASPTSRGTYQPEQPVIFDNVISNFGSAFDPQSSVFTCPVTGVYMFSVHLMGLAGSHAQVALFVDAGVVFQVISDNIRGAYNPASNVAFASCYQGQSVWIKTFLRSNQQIYEYSYTSFSAMLMST